MKIILLKDVPKIGRRFDQKEVADGYGRNVLIAKGLAMVATKENLNKLGAEIKKHELEFLVKKETIERGLRELNDYRLIFKGKANEEGHLFAAIHKKEIIAEVLKTKNIHLEDSWLLMVKPIKEIGEHKIEIKIEGKSAQLVVIIEKI